MWPIAWSLENILSNIGKQMQQVRADAEHLQQMPKPTPKKGDAFSGNLG
jgi:hypothetical protein